MNLGNGKRISDCDEHDRSCHWCQRGAPACFTADAVVPTRPPCTIQASDVSRPPYPQTELPSQDLLIFSLNLTNQKQIQMTIFLDSLRN